MTAGFPGPAKQRQWRVCGAGLGARGEEDAKLNKCCRQWGPTGPPGRRSSRLYSILRETPTCVYIGISGAPRRLRHHPLRLDTAAEHVAADTLPTAAAISLVLSGVTTAASASACAVASASCRWTARAGGSRGTAGYRQHKPPQRAHSEPLLRLRLVDRLAGERPVAE